MLPTLPYTVEALSATELAKSIVRDYRHHVLSGCHLLKAILDSDFDLSEQLEEWGMDVPYLQEWASIRLSEFPKSMSFSEELPIDKKTQKVLETADIIRLKLGETQITLLSVLIAISRPNIVFSDDEMKTFPISEKELLNHHLGISDSSQDQRASSILGKQSGTNSTKGSLSTKKTLAKFCVDKTALAKQGKIDPIIGRDGEVRMMAEILSRRSKPNVIIVGEPGVGKTALVEGLALKIFNGEVTGKLKTATILELDIGALVAGASYKGELEDRLKKVLKEVQELENVILFFDEIHMLLDSKGSMGSGAANLLKPELARGTITVIGATTNDEYRKYIEKDEAFSRRFEVLRIEEPDEPTAVRMLNAILPKYEEHHKLKMDSSAIVQAVKLAKRFLRERSLPDTAIDLMDRTMASIRLMHEGAEEVIKSLNEELKNLDPKGIAGISTYYEELVWFNQQIHQRISPILINQIPDGQEEKISEEKNPKKLKTLLTQKLKEITKISEQETEIVTASHIASIVSYKTGIPVGKVQSQEREKLLQMEEVFGKRVIGQDHAFPTIADAIRNARAKIKDPWKPVGSFFFLGPTGTGKTELTKTIADFLFDDENAIIRFDMSEFKEGHSGSALLGASPGYVGYEEGGPLINKIRQQPYSVVLFDEIEKASKEVFDIFLKILDEGKAKDKLEKEGDFSNAIIIFTSNIGSEAIVEKFKEGKIPDEDFLKEKMKSNFRPEFLARIDGIIPFSFITKEALPRIFDIHFKKLSKRLEEQGVQIKITDKAKDKISNDGYSEEFGVRPLIGEIRKQLGNPISKMLIQQQLLMGDIITADIDKKEELKWIIENEGK